jgi:hypothetical protein
MATSRFPAGASALRRPRPSTSSSRSPSPASRSYRQRSGSRRSTTTAPSGARSPYPCNPTSSSAAGSNGRGSQRRTHDPRSIGVRAERATRSSPPTSAIASGVQSSEMLQKDRFTSYGRCRDARGGSNVCHWDACTGMVGGSCFVAGCSRRTLDRGENASGGQACGRKQLSWRLLCLASTTSCPTTSTGCSPRCRSCRR